MGVVEEKVRKGAWNPETTGFGKHAYRQIDPATVNPADYAHSMRGDEKYYGDIREYNVGANDKHPETTADLYDLGIIGTIFSTNAKGMEGTWKVVYLPRIKAPKIWIVAAPVAEVEREGMKGWEEQDPAKELSAIDLGIMVNEQNLHVQVVTKLIHRGNLDREQRKAASTGLKTRDVLKGRAQNGLPKTNSGPVSVGERSGTLAR